MAGDDEVVRVEIQRIIQTVGNEAARSEAEAFEWAAFQHLRAYSRLMTYAHPDRPIARTIEDADAYLYGMARARTGTEEW